MTKRVLFLLILPFVCSAQDLETITTNEGREIVTSHHVSVQTHKHHRKHKKLKKVGTQK